MDQPESQPRCRCGHAYDDPMVEAEPQYSLGGWLLITMGMTPRPRLLRYRCTRCQRVLRTTRDPELLRKFA